MRDEVGGGRLEALEVGLARLELLPALLGGMQLRLDGGQCLGRLVFDLVVLLLEEVGGRLRAVRAVVGGLHHRLVDVEGEQLREDVLLVLRVAAEEGAELALRQDDRLYERVVVDAEERLDVRVDLVDAVGERLDVAVGVHAFEAGGGGAFDRPHARHEVALAARLELQLHAREIRPVRDEGDDFSAHARDFAEERPDHRVEEGRLAGAGGAGDGEELAAGEVDRDGVVEGGEALEVQADGLHTAASDRLGGTGRDERRVSTFAPPPSPSPFKGEGICCASGRAVGRTLMPPPRWFGLRRKAR